MTTIAFFGHNSAEPAIHRRARSFTSADYRVIGFMMRRGPQAPTPWPNTDLGQTADNAYLQRVKAIWRGASIAANTNNQLQSADIIYARNLDMLLCASIAKRRLKLATPLVYECLDVHRLLTAENMTGSALRRIEHQLLEGCALLVCSSPGFIREYFSKHHTGAYDPFIVENRLIAGDQYPARAELNHPARDSSNPLRLGWFGNLRCLRSFKLMQQLADRFQDRIVIKLRGYPAKNALPNFETDVARAKQIEYEGPYQAPNDLAAIYEDVDIVWAGDYHEAGANSTWLLPNRIYEGGYFATPPIAPKPTETGRWIEDKKAGYTIDEPVEQSLPALIEHLIEDRTSIAQYRNNLLALREDVFVEGAGFIKQMVDKALAKT